MNSSARDKHKTNAFDRLDKELARQIENMPFLIFLCGPALCETRPSATCETRPSATLRKDIKKALEKEQFTVVLGEDEGLDYLRHKFGSDAQTNELHFIKSPECRVVILIADSVGSHCELGLFNWLFASNSNEYFDKNEINFYVIADKQFEHNKSYFNEGPIKTLKQEGGSVEFCDFSSFNILQLIDKLKGIRVRAIKPFSNGSP